MKKKNKKLPKNITETQTPIPQKALIVEDSINYENEHPSFAFIHADPNKCSLCDWNKDDLKNLISCYQKMEKCTWSQVRRHPGFQMKAIKNPPIPQYLSPDETIYEIRVDKARRIHGILDKGIFYLVWFDREHLICPENKVKRA